MTIRKMLIAVTSAIVFEDANECWHRKWDSLSHRCEHPLCKTDDNRCPTAIALWCPLPNARDKIA